MGGTSFMPLNTTNVRIIKDYFVTISPDLFDILSSSNIYSLYQFEGDSNDIYLVPTTLLKVVKKLSRTVPLHHAGIHLGYMRRKRTRTGFERAFYLSYEGGEFLLSFVKSHSPKLYDSLQHITLKSRAEKSFYYGQSLEVLDVKGDIKKIVKKRLIFVHNMQQEYIGLALLIVKQAGANKPDENTGYKHVDRFSRSEHFTLSIMNLSDAGYYLRKGG